MQLTLAVHGCHGAALGLGSHGSPVVRVLHMSLLLSLSYFFFFLCVLSLFLFLLNFLSIFLFLFLSFLFSLSPSFSDDPAVLSLQFIPTRHLV